MHYSLQMLSRALRFMDTERMMRQPEIEETGKSCSTCDALDVTMTKRG